MNTISNYELDRERTIKRICEFFKFERPEMKSVTTKEAIKELCVARLCKSIGITGKYNYKSDFFEFFSSIMGEAICEKLSLKTHVACDELRLVKYEHVNLIREIKSYLDNETIEEAFLDAFHLVDKFKYLIPKLKKV